MIDEDFGILKKDMLCYCFEETKSYLRLWFRTPVIGDTYEIKIPKQKAHILRET